MEADDLMAAVFPALAQCQENATGPIELPDHLLVRQTLADCLHESADAAGLERLLVAMAEGRVRVHLRDVTEPSPLSHEILNARPYTFLDDAPLEERRTRAVAIRSRLPTRTGELARLDPEAIAAVREEARLDPRDAEELHDALLHLVVAEAEPAFAPWLDELAASGRAARVETERGARWLATERRREVEALFPGCAIAPDVRVPAALARRPAPDAAAAAALALRGHLAVTGPATVPALAQRTALDPADVECALAALEAEGFALRGRFSDPRGGEEWCERRLLARIHRATTERLRREIEPVTAQDFLRFLLRWQHVAPGTQCEGRRGLLAVLEQLQGFGLAAGAWEASVLPARVAGYRTEWLDALCFAGELAWARLELPAADAGDARRVPSRATPLGFALRDDLPWLLAAARGEAAALAPAEGPAADVFEALRARGALFLSELASATRREPREVEDALWDLVSRGLVSADGFVSVRGLLSRRGSTSGAPAWDATASATAGVSGWRGATARARLGRGARRSAEGRWSLVPPAERSLDAEALAEAVAGQLLARWGVVFRDLLAREALAVPWRELLWALRRLEARGIARGGRFVTGFVGEQYALPGAVEALRRTRRRPRSGERVRVSAADPLNLVGILTPGPRVPALGAQAVVYEDGLPIGDAARAAGAGR
jgi:ATP-dependent Lhr-like helicase